jgi:hypothetical protein
MPYGKKASVRAAPKPAARSAKPSKAAQVSAYKKKIGKMDREKLIKEGEDLLDGEII